MSKDKAIKKTKTPVTKRTARKTPAKSNKKNLNENKTKTPAHSKSETVTTIKRSTRKSNRNKDIVVDNDIEETEELVDNKEINKETEEEEENNKQLTNLEMVESQQNDSPKENNIVEEVDNQLVEITDKSDAENESFDLNETIIPPQPIEEDMSTESQTVWSKIKSKLSNVLSNLFSFITPTKESEDENNNNKFDPNITIINPSELEEFEEKEENGEMKNNNEIPIPISSTLSPTPLTTEEDKDDCNMHILLNITNDNDEDNSNGMILYQHIPENEIKNVINNNHAVLSETPEEKESNENKENKNCEEEQQEENEQEQEQENENGNENKKNEINTIKTSHPTTSSTLFNFQTTSTPSYYSNIQQPPNLMKRKRFQLHINKNKSNNKPIESEKRYFKLKYIPYTNILAVPPSKRIKTISIEKDNNNNNNNNREDDEEEKVISKSSKVITPNIIESDKINNLSFLSPLKSLFSSESDNNNNKSKLNFDLTKDTKKIFSTLDKLTTPSKIYSQYNNNENNNNEEINNKTKIDFSMVNEDINNSMSLLSKKIDEATEYGKKRNSFPVFDSVNNSIISNSTPVTHKNNSPFSTHDVIEYSFSTPTPSKFIVGSDETLSKEFRFSNANESKIKNNVNINDNDDNDDEFSFSLPKNVPRLEPDNSTYIFAPPI